MEIKNIKTINELINVLESFSQDHIFRGESNYKWDLETSLERHLDLVLKKPDYDKNDDAKFITKVFAEKNVKDEFKKLWNLYDEKAIEYNDNWDILSHMQHYGLPTHLLDFTLSPYVALFFSTDLTLSDDVTHSAIYAIDWNKIHNENQDIINEKYKNELKGKYLDHKTILNICTDKSRSAIHLIVPNEMNIRLKSQQGVFLTKTPGTNSSFKKIIKGNYSNVITKIIYPSELRYLIHDKLSIMNVIATNLFPSLEGITEHIRRREILGKGMLYGR